LENSLSIEQFKKQFSPKEDDLLKAFFDLQMEKWDFARNNYGALKNSVRKIFRFTDTEVVAQFNPNRVLSTMAVTDPEKIKNRKCFLCEENLHKEQTGLELTENYTMLVNPYPVLSKHFTAKFNIHKPQKITENFDDLLNISEIFGEKYFALYNGPDCGASVPEHRHFQAGIASEFTIINEARTLLQNPSGGKLRAVKTRGGAELYAAKDFLRNYFLIRGDRKADIRELFFNVFKILEQKFPSERETKINLVMFKHGADFILLIFPRKAHRPSVFYNEDETQIKVSPATLDYGGVMVFPRKEDFDKIDKETIRQIFNEVGFSESDLTAVADEIE